MFGRMQSETSLEKRAFFRAFHAGIVLPLDGSMEVSVKRNSKASKDAA